MPALPLQVVANYVAMVPNGKIFDNSLEKGRPYDVRVGAGQVSVIFLPLYQLPSVACIQRFRCDERATYMAEA